MRQQPPTTGAECRTQCQVLSAGGVADHQQIDEIRTGYEQNKTDCSEQNEKRSSHSCSGCVLHRSDQNTEVLVRYRQCLLLLTVNRVEFCLRLVDSDSRLQSSDDCEFMIPVWIRSCIVLADRHPDIGVRRQSKLFR